MFGSELFSNIYGIGVAIIVLSILVAVHEAGHLLMAKWSNVRVDIFSIGMGKAIWGFQKGETYYQIGRLPFGGFCGFGDEENPHDTDPRALGNSPLWARLLTVIGGSLFNIIFAYLVMMVMYGVGFQQDYLTNIVYVPTKIIDPIDNTTAIPSPAYIGGIRSGDSITAINDEPVTNFRDITLAISVANNRNLNITYVSKGVTNQTVVNSIDDFTTGINMIGVQPIVSSSISSVVEGGAADVAGLQANDKFLMINGQPIQYFHQILESINSGDSFTATIERTTQDQTTTNNFTIKPNFLTNSWMIGVRASYPEYKPTLIRANNFVELFTLPFENIRTTISQIQVSLVKLFAGQVDVQQNLSGPIRIISITGDIAQTFDYSLLVKFMVMLSLALAIFNLLPFPGLDGGHIVLQTARSIFKNSPIAEKIITGVEQAGVILLLTIAVFVLFNDIKNIFTPTPTEQQNVIKGK